MRNRIREPNLFDSGSGMEKFWSGINISDPQHLHRHFSSDVHVWTVLNRKSTVPNSSFFYPQWWSTYSLFGDFFCFLPNVWNSPSAPGKQMLPTLAWAKELAPVIWSSPAVPAITVARRSAARCRQSSITSCSQTWGKERSLSDHSRQALCCKMQAEFDHFLLSDKR